MGSELSTNVDGIQNDLLPDGARTNLVALHPGPIEVSDAEVMNAATSNKCGWTKATCNLKGKRKCGDNLDNSYINGTNCIPEPIAMMLRWYHQENPKDILT